MHGAPSVSYPVGRSRFAGAFIAAAWLFAAAGLALWASQVNPSTARMAGAGCVLVAAGAIGLRGWMRSPGGQLAWDGEGWRWLDAARAEGGEPFATLDLQRVLLLRWQPQGGSGRWLWAERASQPSSWDDLRRAVYSRARPGGGAPRARGEAHRP
jgi:toxin CptA